MSAGNLFYLSKFKNLTIDTFDISTVAIDKLNSKIKEFKIDNVNVFENDLKKFSTIIYILTHRLWN